MTSPNLSDLIERVEAALPKPVTDEWKSHDGKGRPHNPKSYVEVQNRDGDIYQCGSAFLDWVWEDYESQMDIVRWRFAPEPLSRIRAGELLIDNAEVIAASLRALQEKDIEHG